MPRLSSFNDGYSSEVRATRSGPDPEYLNSTMLFCQGAAPTGWVRDTTNDDCTLRITSGAGAGTGGTVGFSTVLSGNREFSGSGNINVSIGPWTLTSPQVPRHTHNYSTDKERDSSPTVLAPNNKVTSPNHFSGFYFLTQNRPIYGDEPISGDYPTNPFEIYNGQIYLNPAVIAGSPYSFAGHQYRPGRFKPAGGGQAHTHTTSAKNINWQGHWNMSVKYVGAIFAKYTG